MAETDLERARALLALAASGRRGLKQAAARLDAAPELRAHLLSLGRLPEEAEVWPAKKLLRRALGRGEEAQRRSNPIRVDASFVCAACGLEVPMGGAQVRDHCPACLVSLHVDVVPGDRAANCGGALRPVGLEKLGGELILRYRCERCGHRHRCRAHPDDDPRQLARVSALGD